jgi:hypothetical protein
VNERSVIRPTLGTTSKDWLVQDALKTAPSNAQREPPFVKEETLPVIIVTKEICPSGIG